MLSEIKELAEKGYACAVTYGEENSKKHFWKILSLLESNDNQDNSTSAPQRQHNKVYNKTDMQIVAYFLSEYGHEELFPGIRLSQKATIQKASEALGIKAATLKNERDFFDSHTNSHRQGWKIELTNAQQDIFAVMKRLSREEALQRVRATLQI